MMDLDTISGVILILFSVFTISYFSMKLGENRAKIMNSKRYPNSFCFVGVTVGSILLILILLSFVSNINLIEEDKMKSTDVELQGFSLLKNPQNFSKD